MENAMGLKRTPDGPTIPMPKPPQRPKPKK
jgi:hypothetical protein